MMFNPEYDEVDSGSEREGIEEYTPLPIGPWALRLNHIPFADEAVVSESSLPVKFEPRFASLTDPQIFVLVREYLREHINKLSRSPTVSELVIGIIRVIARYFRDKEHSYLDGMGVFISFRGVMNDQHSSPGFLPIEMSVESACAWIERGDEEEKDYEEEGTKRQQAKRQKTMKKRTATNRLA
ncbi:uncharacterized protein DFL_006595 [Arthrobotrys flagrans]|uniref:Uncharacterized protein n=1 Tax=Arthrobotrys flagrans TaxID=97331 RepID=A0A436ZT98_ARTFL|nr:hypothetical protein DFL_006595 [Arthrobotrys flagrans]